jgi:hypothetical protein
VQVLDEVRDVGEARRPAGERHALEEHLVERLVELGAGREVAKDRALGDVGPLGEPGERHGVGTALERELDVRVQERLAGGKPAALAERNALCQLLCHLAERLPYGSVAVKFSPSP